ncbi:hypothetical protein Emed_005932 [Eimeria media]
MESEEEQETQKESPFISRAAQSPFCSRYERYVQLVLKLQQLHLQQEQRRLQQQQQQQQQQSNQDYEPFHSLYVALPNSLRLHAPPHHPRQQHQQLSRLLQGWTFCMDVRRQSDGLLLLLQVALYTPGFVRLRLSEHPQQELQLQRQKHHHKQRQHQQQQQQRRPYAAELLLDSTLLQQLLVQRVETVATSRSRTIVIVNFEPPTIAAAAAAAAAKTEEAAAATAAAEEATAALQAATAKEQTVAAQAAGATQTAIAAAITAAAAAAAWTTETPPAEDAAAATEPQPATVPAPGQPPEAAAAATAVAASVAATKAATARLQRATAATGAARLAAATAAEATAAAQLAAEAATAAAAATQRASLIAMAATAEATAAAATGPQLDCSASDALSPEWLSHLPVSCTRGGGGVAAAAAAASLSNSNNGQCQLAVVIHYRPFAVSIHSNGREVQRLNAQQLLNWEGSSRSGEGQGSTSLSSAEDPLQQQVLLHQQQLQRLLQLQNLRQQEQQQEAPKAASASARRRKREVQGTPAADTAAATAAALSDAVDVEPVPPLEARKFAAAPPLDVAASLSRELQRGLSAEQQQQLQQLLRAPLPELLHQSRQLLQWSEEERLGRRCSIGCDVFFADASGVYGLAEHSTAFKLTNWQEPFRCCLSVSPPHLCLILSSCPAASLPFALSHRHSSSVSAWVVVCPSDYLRSICLYAFLPNCQFFNVDSYSWPLGSPSSLYASLPVLLATHTKKVQGAILAATHQGGPQASAFVLLNPTETFFRVDYDQPPEQQQELQQQQQQPQQEKQGIACWFCSEGGAFEVISCCGPSPADCYRQLHAALGLPAMQRISALGKQQSRWSYETQRKRSDREANRHHREAPRKRGKRQRDRQQEEALEAMAGLDSARVPFDGLWLDIDYAPHCRYFEEDKFKFCLQSLAERLQQQQRLLVGAQRTLLANTSSPAVAAVAAAALIAGAAGPSRPLLLPVQPLFKTRCPCLIQYNRWAPPTILSSDKAGAATACGPISLGATIPSRALGLWNDMNEPSVFGAKELTFPRKTLHQPDPPLPPPPPAARAATHAEAAAAAAVAAEASVAEAAAYEGQDWRHLLRMGVWAGEAAAADAAAAEAAAAQAAAAEAAAAEAVAAEAGVAAEHWEIHNLYGLLQQQASYAGLLARSPEKLRPFLLSRSGFLGSWRFGFLWTGDNEATWPHLRAVVPMVLAAAACGQSLIGADVGGYVGTCGAELLLRWQQLGVWLPFYRVHSDKASARREAFRDALTLPLVRDAVLSRYRMLPHWYTLCMEHALLGDPIIRPLWWLDAAAAAAGNCSSNTAAAAAAEGSSSTQAFLVGSQVYVQPIVHPTASIEKSRDTKQRRVQQQQQHSVQQQQQQQQHSVQQQQEQQRAQKKSVELALPRGYSCCDTNERAGATAGAAATGAAAAGGSAGCCLFPLTLRRIPVFVRGGCIVATRETPRPSALLCMQDPITMYAEGSSFKVLTHRLHVYLSPEGVAEGRLYVDDGVSFECTEGRFIYVRFKARMQEQQQQQQQEQEEEEGGNKMRESKTLQICLESVTLPIEGPASPWRVGALQASDIPNAAVWGVRTPPSGASISRASGEMKEALPFATKELPLNPLEDELRIHRRAFVADAKTQPTPPAQAAAPVACAASAAEEAMIEGRQEQQQQLLLLLLQQQKQQQQKQQQLMELQEERKALSALLQQQNVEDELKQQQQQQQQLFGQAPFYRVVVPTPGALVTDCTWSVYLHW